MREKDEIRLLVRVSVLPYFSCAVFLPRRRSTLCRVYHANDDFEYSLGEFM
jgi:hypothetical protein